MLKSELINKVEEYKANSSWDRGVKEYALELLYNWEDEEIENLDDLLNGSGDWEEYSYSGNSLIYDYDIAKRLCTPSEFTKIREGYLAPNEGETWLDVQARALFQAFNLIKAYYGGRE